MQLHQPQSNESASCIDINIRSEKKNIVRKIKEIKSCDIDM
jgi:hypothetical protein